MAKKLMTRTEVRSFVIGNGWKVSSDRKESDGIRRMFIEASIPYEESKTKKQEYAFEQRIVGRAGLNLTRYDVASAEWGNEDGGDMNLLRIEIYVPVAEEA